MTLWELLEMLKAYKANNPALLEAQVVDLNFFSFDSVDLDVDENGDTVVVID